MAFTVKRKPRKRPRETVQTLGKHTYALPDISTKPYRSRRRSDLWYLPFFWLGMPLYTLLMLLAPRTIRHRLLSLVIPRIMTYLAKLTHNQRKLLLQHVSGRVLDVGTGGAAYLQHLSGKAAHVVCLEPVEEMHPRIRAVTKAEGWNDYQVTILAEGLDSYARTGDSFDWIILGNVLCEVPDLQQALQQVDKLLKPGGHVYFCEHYASDPGTFTRQLQDLSNPIWNRLSGGCNCNRDTLHALEGMPSWDVVSWQLGMAGVVGNSMSMGLARKVAENEV